MMCDTLSCHKYIALYKTLMLVFIVGYSLYIIIVDPTYILYIVLYLSSAVSDEDSLRKNG